MKLYRFSHKTGSYGVTIVEENGDDVLVKVEQVIKHRNKVIYITLLKLKVYFSMNAKH